MSTADTVIVMERLAAQDAAHPAVLEFAQDVQDRADLQASRSGITAGPPQLLAALEALIRERIRYEPDPATHELVRAPGFLLQVEPWGDCDDQMTLAKAVAARLGLRGRFLRLGFRSGSADPFSHVVIVFRGAENGMTEDLVVDSTVPLEAQAVVLEGFPMRFEH